MAGAERSIEQSGIPVCPYWRRWVVEVDKDNLGVRILALCGRARGEQPQAEDTDIGPRLPTCPWFEEVGGPEQAYRSPATLEITGNRRALLAGDFGQMNCNVLFCSELAGASGIKEAESVWPSAEEDFLKRV